MYVFSDIVSVTVSAILLEVFTVPHIEHCITTEEDIHLVIVVVVFGVDIVHVMEPGEHQFVHKAIIVYVDRIQYVCFLLTS